MLASGLSGKYFLQHFPQRGSVPGWCRYCAPAGLRPRGFHMD